MRNVPMLRTTFIASIIGIFGALPAQAAQVAAKEATAPMLHSVNPAMMRMKPISNGAFVLAWNSGTITCNGYAIAPIEWIDPHP